MQVKIILFGQLTDITGSDSFTVSDVHNTDELVTEINKSYPLMKDAKYIIAVNKKIISNTTLINESSSVALLPPFSGG